MQTQNWKSYVGQIGPHSPRAREEPQCQFVSLAHLLDERFLAACYHRLGRDRASGVDGVTWKEYGEHLDENLRTW